MDSGNGNKQKELLSKWLNRKKEQKQVVALGPLPAGEKAPLSYGQERLWLLQQLYPENPLYNYAHTYHFKGVFKEEWFLASLEKVVARHAILQTNFRQEGEDNFQVQRTDQAFELRRFDLADLEKEAQEIKRVELTQAQIQRPFDLSKEPLLRIFLFKLSDQEWLVLLMMHHIIGDRESLAILNGELFDNYKALAENKAQNLPALPVQYQDFAFWQRKKPENKAHLDYWLKKLDGELPILELPTDFDQKHSPSFKGQTITRQLPGDLSKAFIKYSSELGATLFVTTLAAFKVLLYRYSGQTDILVGAPFSNRDKVELEKLIGFFNETMVLRSEMNADQTFAAFVNKVKQTTLDAFAHRDVPFSQLVHHLNPERQGTANPIFQVMFVFDAFQPAVELGEGLVLEEDTVELGVSKFDLTAFVGEKEDHLTVSFEYASDLFKASTIERMLAHYEALIADIVQRPQQNIAQFNILPLKERTQILSDWNFDQTPLPKAKSVVDLFEAQVKGNEGKIAVTFQQEAITYAELNDKANRIAHFLSQKGDLSNKLIGLYAKPSKDIMPALMGILKAGAAYLPLDPDYPKERIEYIVEDAEVDLVLKQDELSLELSERIEVLGIRQLMNTVGNRVDDLTINIDGNQLAYMIYTSGSTGRPKGVPITHDNLLHSTTARFHYYDRQPSAFLLLSSFSFDSSIAGLFWTMVSGGKLVLTPKRSEQDMAGLAGLVEKEKVTHSLMLPSLYQLLLEYAPTEQLSSLETIMVAGEASFPSLVRLHYKKLPQTLLYNEYGPTEGTVWSTVHLISAADAENVVPIGKPIPYTQNYILNESLEPVPIGIAGELYIAGKGISKGYWKRPELTKERFLPNPFGEGMLYKTGDLTRYREDGLIEFLGRADHQVKIRGHRVELDEVKSRLLQVKGVEDAVVLVKQEGNINTLFAYLKGQPEATVDAIKSWLGDQLPNYMVPAAIGILDDFPRLPNGKVNQKALPEIKVVKSDNSTGTPPETALEKQLAEIWKAVLKLDQINVEDNFFEIGGDSIRSIQVIAKAQKEGIEIAPNHLFEYQDIQSLAAFLSDPGAKENGWSSIATINKGGTKTPLFCIHSGAAHVFFYRNLANYLGEDQPVYALQPKGLSGQDAFHNSIEEMAAFYVKEIKRIQPKGPYSILGTCFSNAVGLEMAHQLKGAGDELELLVFVDSGPAHLIAANIRGEKKTMQRFGQMVKAGDWKGIIKKVRNRGIRLQRKLTQPFINEQQQNLQKTINNLNQLYKQYNWKPIDHKITFIRSTEFANRKDKDYQLTQWEHLANGNLDVHVVEGHHLTLFEEPEVKGLAEQLRASIASGFTLRE